MATEFALERIYVKDISFESPRSPQVFREPWQPQVQLDLNTKATSVGDDRFEVVLTVTVNVRSQDALTNAIVEVQQAGVFRLKGLPDDQRSRMLATYCPNVLFPYVREAVDALMQRGGMPALLLSPVNFDSLFEEALKRRAAKPADDVNALLPKGGTEH
jgi:preprotein translocase subunit SecB